MQVRLRALRIAVLSILTLCNVQSVWPADLNTELQNAVLVPNNEAKVKELIDKGADVTTRVGNPWNTTPLMFAATVQGNVKTVTVLLEAAKKLGDQKFKEYVNAQDNYGNTALSLERQRSKDPAIEAVLISAGGADVKPQPSKVQKAAESALGFIGKLKAKIELKQPITAMDIPGLDKLPIPDRIKKWLAQIQITSPTVNEIGADKIVLKGQIKIGNVATELGLEWSDEAQSIYLQMPGAWNFTDFFPELKEALLKSPGIFKEFAQVITSPEYVDIGIKLVFQDQYDPLWKRELKRGINISFKQQYTGGLKKIYDLLGLGGTEFFGWITKDIVGSTFETSGPEFKFKFPNGLETKGFTKKLVITDLAPSGIIIPLPMPSVSLETSALIPFPHQELIGFTVRAQLFMDKMEVVGFTSGIVHNFMGLRGVNIGNLGFGFTIDYKSIFDTIQAAAAMGAATFGVGALVLLIPPIRGFQATGTVGLGTSPDAPTITMLGKGEISQAKGFGDIGWQGKLDGVLSAEKMIDFFAGLIQQIVDASGKKFDVKKRILSLLPANIDLNYFNVSDLEMKFAPKAMNIGEEFLPYGLSAQEKFRFLGKNGKLNLYVGRTDFNIEGWYEKFELGPIKISGAGPDQIAGTADDGPSFKFILDPLSLFMDCRVQAPILGGIDSAARMDVTLNGFDVKLKQKLANMFDTDVDMAGKFTDAGNLDQIYVKANMTQTALRELEKYLKDAAKENLIQAQANLSKAQGDVANARTIAERDINAHFDTLIAQTQANIDAKYREIDAELARRLGECEKKNAFERPICKKVWAQEPRSPLYHANIAIAALKVHKDVTLPASRWTALQAVKAGTGVAQVAIQTSQSVVTQAQKVNDFAAKVLEYTPNIKRVAIEGSLSELMKQGTLPKLSYFEVEYTIPGLAPRNIVLRDLQLDVKNPLNFARELLKQLEPQL